MKLQELNADEMKAINGGGGDDYVESNTDYVGNTGDSDGGREHGFDPLPPGDARAGNNMRTPWDR